MRFLGTALQTERSEGCERSEGLVGDPRGAGGCWPVVARSAGGCIDRASEVKKRLRPHWLLCSPNEAGVL